MRLASRHFIERRGSKQCQIATSGDYREVVPVGGKIQRPDLTGGTRSAAGEAPENGHFAAKENVPKSDGMIAATTGQGLAIGRKRQGPNRLLMPIEGGQAFSGFEVPKLDD